ncbi:hypothetical protein GA0116948_1098 [Chitinophaga costaii]|uniref:Zinc-finger n=1 Tax=Chitinophaga costaii TaxID=1335309 RepID=A0A1C4ELB4_9BACT|nr:hypothetical protein [Chitinophaga costaii]PUZ22423.1 hypothetical protein DCM91_14205 [Chitinophaga costaii]SCC44347.1 hypothetical protein GA0116948_1098 [Chitinophaga costaii]
MIKNKLIRNTIMQLHAQSNCRRATFLIEKKENTRLTIGEWLQMQAHLAICPLCTLYKLQSRLIQQMIVKIFQQRKNSTFSMSEDKKAALNILINNHLNQG